MVDDENIKTTVSPFAIREGEIKKFDGNDGYVSINQIIHKINLGHINEIHFQILDLIFLCMENYGFWIVEICREK